MLFRKKDPELTVYVTNDREEFRRVEAELLSEGVRFRVWTTEEYPVFGFNRLDPRLIARGERRLRKVFHVDVRERDRLNLITANITIRRVTGRISNAASFGSII